ncbi:MAG: rhomboid family intramembrane serine protease [Terracidiphilus sp.]|jgi:rhomboid protease GluP
MGSNPSTPDPEYLAPEAGFNPPPPVRRPRPSWAYAPATYALVAINCLVFLWMTARGVSVWNPTPDQLLHFGADNAGSVLINGEWIRIVTAMFVHVGIIHLATNMWCLWNLGLLAEPLMGSAGVLAVYILTGAAGNLLSTFYNWGWPLHDSSGSVYFPVGAGASGAVFGIAGALIVLLKSHRLPVPPLELHKLRRSVIYFAAINLAIGITISLDVVARHTGVSVDNSAHLGGVLCGLLFALPLVPRIGSPREEFLFRLRMAIAMVVGILVLFGFFISHVRPPN